jgi:hypothetical protein
MKVCLRTAPLRQYVRTSEPVVACKLDKLADSCQTGSVARAQASRGSSLRGAVLTFRFS